MYDLERFILAQETDYNTEVVLLFRTGLRLG